jgi:hypothetical protein
MYGVILETDLEFETIRTFLRVSAPFGIVPLLPAIQ